MVYFETGLLMIKGEKIKIMEINVNASRELNEHYNSDSHDPEEIRRGRKKVEFSIKRALDTAKLSNMYEKGCEFAIVLYNNDPDPPQAVIALEKCVFGSDKWGNFDGTKPVTQDMDGKAIKRRILLNEAQAAPENIC
jgi:hypothetical protein